MDRGHTKSPIRRDVVFFVVSSIVHALWLAGGWLTFAAKPIPKNPNEAMPIDIISAADFSQLTAGTQNAPKVETPKPVAEKIGERKPVDDPNAKVEKKEIKAATDQPPPMPEPKPPAPAEKKESEPKRDLIAEAIKKDLAKQPEPKKSEQKKAEAKADAKAESKAETKAPPKKDQPKFDPRNVEALLNKQ